jgi:hypothetical protein
MINHPNRSDSHEIRFVSNGVTVDAEYRQLSKSGHLSGWLDGQEVVDLGWIDYQPDFMTDKGLESFARSELALVREFNADPINFGEGEAPNAEVVALLNKALV